ncbi:MAG: hypothetical protein D6674_08310 [Acidobacteria bacterium]|jgi:hypothetical protein|nr:MAG: hypothetical protein D6674_08310 [Acidobacteriota bacterium]
MAQIANLECFKLLIKHEIGELKRIKKDLNLDEHIPGVDNFSIVLLYSEFSLKDYLQSVVSSMRASDIIATLDNFILCLLPGTDKEGGIHLAEGIKDFLGERGYYIVITYPEDGSSYEELMASLELYSSSKGKRVPAL